MSIDEKQNKLQKQFKLADVYAVATGATISAGFFLLPGLAATQAGYYIPLVYLVAAIPLIPAMLSIIELSTAMPRAGGMYYFLDRALSPLIGTVGGIGTWFALILKVSFALVGLGFYIQLFIPAGIESDFVEKYLPKVIAIVLALGIGVLNLTSVKSSGKFQIFLVAFLLSILIFFIGIGMGEVDYSRLPNIEAIDYRTIISTAGLVFISYVGVTNVASLSEEVDRPGKNLPKAVLLSFFTAILIYFLGTLVMVGATPLEQIVNNRTLVATTAESLAGSAGKILIFAAAFLAFISVANAGMLGASRYPLAMSRDFIFPLIFRKVNKKGIPVTSVGFTLVIVVTIILSFDVVKIAKLASAFQLLMFSLICLAVIVMRESRIESYDPAYRAPLYPYLQIMGVILPLWFIFEMGFISIIFSLSLILLGIFWYYKYARKQVVREGAIYHLFERLGQRRDEGLDRELRGILKEKGLREEDPFDEVVAHSFVLDVDTNDDFAAIAGKASSCLARRLELSEKEILEKFLEGTQVGRTPVSHGIALPHLKIDGLEHPELVMVRTKSGIKIEMAESFLPDSETDGSVYALFFLISPANNPSQHLRILAQIAGRVDEESFLEEWLSVEVKEDLKEVMLRDEHFVTIVVNQDDKSEDFIGKAVRNLGLPEGTLITLIRRDNLTSIPSGSTIIHEGDKLTIIGASRHIATLQEKYGVY